MASRGCLFVKRIGKEALKFGSCAMEIHESCQVRNEAALSETFHVPQGRLDRAFCPGSGYGQSFEVSRADYYMDFDWDGGIMRTDSLCGSPIFLFLFCFHDCIFY